MTRFLIFGLERSGTTSIASLLNHAVAVVHEPFSSLTGDLGDNPALREILERRKWLPEQLGELQDDGYGFNRFHRLALCHTQCDTYLRELFAAFDGIKHVWNPLSRQANLNILQWCMAHEVTIVFHSRRNLARSVLSRILAQQADIHNFGEDLEGKSRWDRMAFEPVDVEDFQAQLDELRVELDAHRAILGEYPHFAVYYEDLFQGEDDARRNALNALCRFVGIQPKALPDDALEQWFFRDARRQTSGSTLERIPNFADLKHLL